MKELTEKWKITLDLKIEKGDDAIAIIRHAIKDAIISKFLPLGYDVPPYRKMAMYMTLDKGTVERALNKLKNEDLLIIAISRKKRIIVSHLPFRRGPSKPKLKELTDNVPTEKILFDQDIVLQNDGLTKVLNTKFNTGLKTFGKLGAMERNELSLSGLSAEMAKALHESLKRNFKASEVWCAEGYHALIHLICCTLLPAKMFIAIASPVRREVKETIDGVTNRVVYLAYDEHGVLPEPLELLCRQQKVGIVYICSRMPCPFNHGQLANRITRLLELQQQYGFIILEDDRYAGFYENSINLLMQQAAGMNAKIVYCCPLSLSNPRLNKINMVAAPEKIIAKLSKKATKMGLVLEAGTAYATEEILKKGVLTKNEIRLRTAIRETNTLTRSVLQDFGLFELEGYNNKKGWFFYLVSMKGHLPENIYAVLANAGYGVVDLSQFESMPELQKGVLISMAAHLGNVEMAKKDLSSLCTFLSKHILFNPCS